MLSRFGSGVLSTNSPSTRLIRERRGEPEAVRRETLGGQQVGGGMVERTLDGVAREEVLVEPRDEQCAGRVQDLAFWT